MQHNASTAGKYIVVDGIDGGGKSSLFLGLQEIFSPEFLDNRASFVYTREPGGTPIGERMRSDLLSISMSPFSEMCGFFLQRKEVREQVVVPALRNGATVISDRSDSATFAYQIKGRQLSQLEDLFWQMQKHLEPFPTLYIFLDLDPLVAAKRMRLRESGGQEADKFEKENVVFFERVRLGFFEFSKKVSAPCYFVNADQNKKFVLADVVAIIRAHLAMC